MAAHARHPRMLAGGASCLKYLEAGGPAAGAVLLCSVPPSGNGPMVLRFLRRSLRQAWLITRGFAAKAAATDVQTCRDLFFDERTPLETVARYLPLLEADAQVGLDVGHFTRHLPSACTDSATGRATWLDAAPPTLVLGADRDGVVDREGVEETAAFLGTRARFVDLPHDVMCARHHGTCPVPPPLRRRTERQAFSPPCNTVTQALQGMGGSCGGGSRVGARHRAARAGMKGVY